MTKKFEKVKKNFGFGCMRLPEKDGKIDYPAFCEMVDEFIEAGFNYFDTAHGYHNGKSEIAIRECISKRYDREDFVLVNKLTDDYFKSNEEIRPFFEQQLIDCGVEYFDFYLMHAQTLPYYKKYQKCRAYETAYSFKKEGKIKHFGISFHDKPEVLDMILTEHPEIEIVQIQLNYVDYLDSGIEGKACYEVCQKHNKPVIVMEPVKGGSLVNLPKKADEILRALDGGSNASYAIRYTASFENVAMVLSGMSNIEQVKENVAFMSDFKPLEKREYEAIEKVCEIFKSQDIIPCTACRYCVEGCPKGINIPALFSDMNAKKQYNDWNSDWYYEVHTGTDGKASDCIKCGKCESICPQHIKIRDELEIIKQTFEK